MTKDTEARREAVTVPQSHAVADRVITDAQRFINNQGGFAAYAEQVASGTTGWSRLRSTIWLAVNAALATPTTTPDTIGSHFGNGGGLDPAAGDVGAVEYGDAAQDAVMRLLERGVATVNSDGYLVLAHPPLAQSVDQALLARAETAWQRFFYPANDCFDKSPAGNKLPFVDLEVADCLRLLLSAVGHEVRPPAGGEVSIIAPADPTVACLKLDVAAQECLQDSAYKAGLAAGWNFAHSDDEAGFQRARSSTEHVAELRRIRAERTAIRNLKGQPS